MAERKDNGPLTMAIGQLRHLIAQPLGVIYKYNMSQSVTLYRILKTDFEENRSDQQQLISLAKGFATFEQSFLGLDFVLKKGEDDSTQKVLDEIFNPVSTGENGTEPNFDNLNDEELDDLFLEENLFSHLPTDKVRAINSKLEKLTKEDIAARFNPEELNENDIYPSVWHSDNSPEQAFNSKHILEDFEQLKSLFSQASEKKEYILQFIG